MSDTRSASRRIADEVTRWEGVTSGMGIRGELSFKIGRKELGHLHGDSAAHFAFARDGWAELKVAGRIADHPVFPGRQGLAARRIATEDDIRDVVAMLRINYDRMTGRRTGE